MDPREIAHERDGNRVSGLAGAAEAAVSGFDSEGILLRLLIDVVALTLLAVVLYFRRYGRRDVVVTLVSLNVGLFAVLTVITSSEMLSAGVGFGLFAVLSIIRLRSETVSNIELGYFFLALAIGLVNGFELHSVVVVVGLNLLLLVAIYVVDHPSLHTSVRRRNVLLDEVITDSDGIRARLSAAFDLEIVALAITDVDYVRETTRVEISYVANPLTVPRTTVDELPNSTR
jgi:hypothetical protein